MRNAPAAAANSFRGSTQKGDTPMSTSILTNWWGRTYLRFLHPARATPKPDLSSAENRHEYVGDLTELARLSCEALEVARAGGSTDPAPSPELVSWGIALDVAWDGFNERADALAAFNVKAEWAAA